MKSIKKIIIWALLLTKRLYKKPTFLILLIAIPLVCLGFSVMAQEDSGFVTVAIAQLAEDDPLSQEVVHELTQDSHLIRYIICSDRDEAQEKVRLGKADCAWVFCENFSEKVMDYAQTRSNKDAPIEVIQREETTLIKLTREKLSGAMFECVSREHYLDFIRDNAPELSHLTDEELMEYFDEVETPQSLFTFEYVDSQRSAESATEKSYLITPLRGLLSVMVVLAGLATSMYFTVDKNKGRFSFAPTRYLPLIELGYELISTLNVAVAVFISMWALKVLKNPLTEIVSLLLYCVSVSVFCMLIRSIFSNLSIQSVVTPIITIVLIAVCPIFFNMGSIRWIQHLLPPTYFVNVGHSAVYLMYMLVYSLVVWCLYCMVRILRKTE